MNKHFTSKCIANIFTTLSKPINRDIVFFLLIWLLFTGVNFFMHSIPNHMLVAWVVSYILVIPNLFFNKALCRVWSFFVFVAAFLDFCISTFCYATYNKVLDKDIAAIIRGTNLNEAVEFLSTYVTMPSIVFFVVSLSVAILFYRVLGKFVNGRGSISLSVFFGLITISGCVILFSRDDIRIRVFPEKYVHFFYFEEVPDLSVYVKNPEITYQEVDLVDNVVLIVGESFSKYHSSIYGYGKNTNPYLTSLPDSLLHLFHEVYSSECSTIKCFKNLMSSYKTSYSDSVKWYECCTLIEVMRRAGYKTHWLSNQSKFGLWDNVVGKYAALCDTEYFAGSKFEGVDRTTFDEELIYPVKCLSDTSEGRNFFVINLIGSHADFSKRYPDDFLRFTPDEYKDYNLTERNRRVVSYYDNSIAYNDSVVFELINLFKEKEALVIYLSDHGLDVFNTDDDYIGHATEDATSRWFGCQIPFIVYTSPLFVENHSDKILRISKNRKRVFCTDNLIYSIMDILGISSVLSELNGESLFSDIN